MRLMVRWDLTCLVVDDDLGACAETARRAEADGDGTDQHVDFFSLAEGDSIFKL
jgi:hypothetical protein